MKKIIGFAIMAVVFVGCGAGNVNKGSATVKKVEASKLFEADIKPRTSSGFQKQPQKQNGKTEAILKLDTLGHTAKISDVIITKNQKIITASNDKTIREWNLEGKEERKILGQIGKGSGEIFAIALSPDERYLAVGGLLAGKERSDKTAIRIYSYQNGKLLKVLKSHTNVVQDLAFSPEGKYLISGSQDETAKIWSITEQFKLIDTIKFHSKQVYAVKIIKKGGIYFAVTAGLDNKIALYNLKERKIVKSHSKNYKLKYLAISKNHIAVSGLKTKEIGIYDYDLNLLKTISSKTKPSGLAYSPNGEFLIAGTEGNPHHNVNIYQTTNYQKISTFSKHKNLTMAVGFINNQRAISCGGNNNEIYIWDIKSAKVAKKIVGVGESVWSVGVKGDKIAWGNKARDIHNDNSWSIQKSLNLKTGTLNSFRAGEKPQTSLRFLRISTKNGKYSLTHQKGGDYGYDAVLVLKENGKVKAKITRGGTDGYRHNCYGFYKNFIISGGMNGQLKIYNFDGKEVANLVGHTGEVWSIAVNRDRLVSGSDDQTIKVWDLSSVDLNVRQKPNLQPQLNIFVAKNNEWVVWTKEGFFNASANGAKYIGYHINQGAEKEAKFLSVAKLYDTFYRPDLIQKALNGENLGKYAKKVNIQKLISGGVAPSIKIMTDSGSSKERDIDIDVKICNEGGGYDNLTMLLNNTPIKMITGDRAIERRRKKITRSCFSISQTISLQNGINKIGFRATDKTGKIASNTDEITLNYKAKFVKQPSLHILTISVDDYKEADFKLKYSNNDATAILKKMKGVTKSTFKNIYGYSLKDKEVVRGNISKKFAEIAKKVDVEDVFVLFIAGHGTMNDQDGNYYFIPYDFLREDKVVEKAISQQDLMRAMAQIPATKSVILIDTCHAGSFDENLQTTAMERLTTTVGRAIISASSANQVALEGYENHGVFTYSLLDSLDNAKVYGFDDKLSISEIANYLKYILPKRTMKKWGYKQEPKSFLQGNDFVIGKK